MLTKKKGEICCSTLPQWLYANEIFLGRENKGQDNKTFFTIFQELSSDLYNDPDI